MNAQNIKHACYCKMHAYRTSLSMFQLRMGGDSEGALLEGVEDDKEYQISLSALYADGAQSEAVATRYSTCK